jgi:TPR repeat protein
MGAVCPSNGNICSQNIPLGLILAKDSFKHGSLYGYYAMALSYYWGLGRPENLVEASRCFRIAAAQNHATSLTFLGFMYEHGLYVSRDYDEAHRCYSQAAEQGYGVAQKNLKCLEDKIESRNACDGSSDGESSH